MAKHNLHYSTVVHCQATHQSQHGFYRGQLTHICSKACSCRGVDFVQQCSLSLRSAHSFTAVAFRDISSTALRKLLLATEMHMTVCGLQATHRPTIVAGLLRQNCFIKVSLLGGLWMAKQWLTPRGRWRILRELRENRGFRWVIGRYMPIEFGILRSP